MAALSSVMATAGAGLLASPPSNVGTSFITPTALGNAVTAFNNVTIIGDLQAVWEQ